MAERIDRSRQVRLALVAVLLWAGCGGKSALEIDSFALPASQGGDTSWTGKLGGAGGSTPIATSNSLGGTFIDSTSSGGRSFATGGRLGTAGVDVVFGGKSGFGGMLSTSGGSTLLTCPDATTRIMAPFTIEGNLGEYPDRHTPSCGYTPGASDYALVWYVSEPDTYIIDTFGSEVDTALAAYTGSCEEAEFACSDDDATFSRQSRIVLDVASSRFVTLVVDGPPGEFLLHVARANSLIDTVLKAEVPAHAKGTTIGKADSATSVCNGKLSSSDMTFLFPAPASGTYQFVVESSSFDAVLSLRDGGPAGEEVTCNDGFVGQNPSVTYPLRAGQSVAVVVDGFQGQTGDFNLYITEDSTDSGSCCSSSVVRPGCLDPDVMRCVCNDRRDCCRYYWDASCVEAVDDLGCGSCSLL